MNKAIAAGFVPMITPTLVKSDVMAGAGFLDHHADEVYRLEADDLYLTGTSEVALAGYHADEVIDLSKGPIRYAGQSTCYRREAGSYGKDTRGIIRVHQFNKIEMFVYCRPDDAAAEHERLLEFEKEMLGAVELPYRIIDTAAGDLGGPAARKYDCEAWVPTQGRYRELTSTSNCTTFQARRLNTRFKGEHGNEVAATLNGTLATTRWIVAILENHQQPDGSRRRARGAAPVRRSRRAHPRPLTDGDVRPQGEAAGRAPCLGCAVCRPAVASLPARVGAFFGADDPWERPRPPRGPPGRRCSPPWSPCSAWSRSSWSAAWVRSTHVDVPVGRAVARRGHRVPRCSSVGAGGRSPWPPSPPPTCSSSA